MVLVELFFILGVTIPTKAAKKCVVPVGKASARHGSQTKFDKKISPPHLLLRVNFGKGKG